MPSIAPCVPPGCPLCAPYLCAPYVHPICPLCAPYVHPMCVLNAPYATPMWSLQCWNQPKSISQNVRTLSKEVDECPTLTPGTDFFITASNDGHLKFWKKRFEVSLRMGTGQPPKRTPAASQASTYLILLRSSAVKPAAADLDPRS